MPTLDARRMADVGAFIKAAREDKGMTRSRVTLEVDREYRPDVRLSEAFASVGGSRPPTEAVSSFLGGYVPEGNHRDRMAAKRHVDKDDLFALLSEFGGSVAGAVTLTMPMPRTSRSATCRSGPS